MRHYTHAPARHALAFAILAALSAPVLAQTATQAAPAATAAADAPAQDDADADAKNDAKTLDTVRVTGSRIPPRAGFDTLEPATVVAGEAIRERGMINVADALNQTVGFGFPTSPEGGQGNYAAGANFVNRFGLGTNRTLTLINGRRVVTSRAGTNFGAAAGMQVDLNAVPTQMVERVENLTVGGAPTYGSDAIAGTVNIILKDHYEGAEVNFNYGQTAQGNSRTLGYSGIYGMNFAEDRGNVVLSWNYANVEGMMYADNDFYRQSLNYVANSGTNCGPNDGRVNPATPCNTSATDGIPGLALYRDLRTYIYTFGGLALPDNVAGTGEGPAISNSASGLVGFGPNATRLHFNGNGELVPYDQGLFHTTTSATGGDGVDLAQITPLLQNQLRHSVSVIGHFDLSDSTRVFWEGMHYQSINGGPAGNGNTITNSTTSADKNEGLRVRADHPLLSAQARQVLAAQGITGSRTFRMNRIFRDLASAETTRGTIDRWVVGMNGYFELGNRTIDWEASANWGRMQANNEGLSLNHQKFMNAINNCQTAVQYIGLTDPTNRTLFSGLTNDAACVPLDPFGEGRASQAAKDYVMETARTQFRQEEQVYSAFAHTDLLDLWSGPVAVAVGVEHRREKAAFENDAFNREGRGRSVALNDLHGQYHTNEYYGEVSVPLAAPQNDIPFLHRLDLKAKYRRVDNSLAGGFNAYTYGLQWEPMEGLLFRGNMTRSLRAPSIVELFLQPVQLFQAAVDPCGFGNRDGGPDATVRRRNCAAVDAAYALPATFQQPPGTVRALRQGNRDLRNESADSWTAGVVWSPGFVDGLTLAVDYNEIKLKDQILALSAQIVLNACYDDPNFNLADPANGNAYCSLINRRPGPYDAATNPTAGQFDPFRLAYLNGEFVNFNAWTGELSYRLDAGNAGKFNFGANAVLRKRHEIKNTPVDVIDNIVGELSTSRLQYRLDAGWNKGNLGLHAGMRYTSSVKLSDSETVETRDFLTVPNYRLYNAGISYKVLGGAGTLRLNVDNLTDQMPEGAVMAGALAIGDYDVQGRRYMFSMEWKFH